jgi:hypothetical protein
MMTKKRLVPLLLLLISLAFGYLYFSYIQVYQPEFNGSLYKTTPDATHFSFFSKSTKEFLGCNLEDEISYLTYESKSPESVKNNKFGLYIYAENAKYTRLADELVNSNGGDWGYVLIPFNIRDRDDGKWGRVFSDLHKRHLIPVVQLYDIKLNTYEKDTVDAAKFLNSFLWPVRERYISVYNEPNDAKFWLGYVSAQEYAQVLDYTITVFKKQNKSFYMLNGALNASAPDNLSIGYKSPQNFLSEMHKAKPGIFEKLDGWASHSYPQPNFSGSPYSEGLWSIRAYDRELAYLKSIGVKKDFDVFITETGWAHAEGDNYNSSYYTSEQIGDFLEIAFEEVWLQDDRVKAVMPFTIYFKPPFDHFSWVNEDYVPYAQFQILKKIKKTAGTPYVLKNSVVNSFFCKKVL